MKSTGGAQNSIATELSKEKVGARGTSPAKKLGDSSSEAAAVPQKKVHSCNQNHEENKNMRSKIRTQRDKKEEKEVFADLIRKSNSVIIILLSSVHD